MTFKGMVVSSLSSQQQHMKLKDSGIASSICWKDSMSVFNVLCWGTRCLKYGNKDISRPG